MGIPWVLLVCVPAVPLSEPDVTFPFSNVNVDCGVVPSDSERESVEPQTLSLSRKREAFFVQSREDLNFDGALVKTPPVSRKKIHRIEYGGEHRWTARDRAVTARMVLSESLEVDTEELEYYLRGPDESAVDVTHIARSVSS